MPVAPKRRWSLEEVEHLMEERPGYTPRYELVDGELLVTPSPSDKHQRIAADLYWRLRPYVERHGLGEARISPGAVQLDAHGHVEPDVYVVPTLNGKRWRMDVSVNKLLLAVEVLSPASVRHDRFTKRRFFQRHGVPEYWVVDGEAEAFEVWKPQDERALLIDERLVWTPDAPEPFVLDVKEFFAAIADD